MSRIDPISASPTEPAARALPSDRSGIVHVLLADPELGARIPPEEVVRARERLVVPIKRLDRGVWEVPAEAHDDSRLGFLILDGLLARDLILAGSVCTELLGEGDVLQPWVAAREGGLVRYRVLWQVLEPLSIAVLDERFAVTAMQWPQVTSALLERAIRRTIRMSIHQALLQLSPVETRLLILFWHLAERWGRVTPSGVLVPLSLSHQILGQLVGCRRASVTTALKEITANGHAVRRSDGSWLLTGSPPDELSHVHWERQPGQSRPRAITEKLPGRRPGRPHGVLSTP